MYLQGKNQHCIFMLCVLFAAKLKHTILFALVDHLSEQNLGFLMNFLKKMFPITPPGNGNVGLGPRELSEWGFKVGKNSPPPKKIAGEISAKNENNFFGTRVFSTF
jgi:hypothetical protein